MPLKEAIQKLTDSVDDLVSLEVLTFTGSLHAGVVDNGRINWQKFAPDTDDNLILAAATHVRPDMDVINFHSSDTRITNIDELLELHNTVLEASQRARLDLISLVKDALIP